MAKKKKTIFEEITGVKAPNYNISEELEKKFPQTKIGTKDTNSKSPLPNLKTPKSQDIAEASIPNFEPFKPFTDIQLIEAKPKNLGKGAFKDGYDFGDITKTILGTGADIALNAAKGVAKVGEGIGDVFSLGVAQAADWLGFDTYAKDVRNQVKKSAIDEILAPVDKVVDKNSIAGKKIDTIAQTVGNIGGFAAGGAFGKGAEALTMFLSGAGGSAEEALNKKGASDAQVWTKALAGGAISMATEKLFGLFGKSGLDTAVANKISSKLTSGAAKTLARQGIQATAESLEEFIEYAANQGLDWAIDKVSNGKGARFKEDWNWEEVGEQMANAFAGSLIVGGGQTAIGAKQAGGIDQYAKQVDTANGLLTENEQRVLDSVINQRIEEASQNKDLSKKEKNAIETQAKEDLQSGNISVETIENTLGLKNYINDVITDVESKMGRQITQQEANEISQLTRNRFLENLQNDRLLQNSYNENNKKSQAFTYELTDKDSEYKANLYKSAENKANDTALTHKFVDSLAKLSEDRNVQYLLTNNEELANNKYAIKDKLVNGLVDENGNVLINIDSNKALNSIVGHETTHLLEGTQEYQDLQDSILEYAKTRGDYESRLSYIQELYKDIANVDVNGELTADLVGDYLFTDENFINNLSTQKPTLFQKIKNLIDDLVVKFTGTKQEKELRKVQKSFEKAYRESSKTQKGTQYSLATNKDSKGRTLTKEQQEYFKDSKVVDENGNLQVVYHGTPNDFTIFNTKDFGGKNGTAEGFGIYLTDNIEVADDYLQQDKGKVMELYANITKPATTSDLTVNKQDIIQAIRELTYKDAQEMVNDGDYGNINDALKDTWISNYTYTYDKSIEQSYNDVAQTILDGSENDYEVIQELMNGSGNNDYKNANDFYKVITDALGFDGIQTKWDFSNDSELKKKNADIWIAFNSNQVKNIDNTNPTSNSDIRYSLSVKEANTGVDNKGRKLSKAQQEYFKDTKLVDNEGNLQVVYHTTPNKFTIFDINRAGENTGYDNTAFGSFITSNKNFSERFGDINEEGLKGNTMELYANITNPITHPYNADYKYSGQELDNIVENWFNAIGETEAIEELKSYVEEGEYDNLYQAYRNTVEFSDESPFEYANDEKEILKDKGYDGVEFVEGLDKDVNYGVGNSNEPVSSYAVFDSNQLKNVDNTNPTTNDDIRYSLSNQNEDIAPVGDYNVYGEQIKRQVNDAIAPIKDSIDEINKSIEKVMDNIAPTAEQANKSISQIDYDKLYKNMNPKDIVNDQVNQFVADTYGEEYTPPQINIDEQGNKQVIPKEKSAFRQAKDTFKRFFTNSNVEIDNLAEESGNKNIKYAGDMLNSVMGEAQGDISVAQTNNNGEAIGKSINQIFSEANKSGLSEAFNDYLIQQSNIDRHNQGKGSIVPVADSELLVREYEKTYPQFKEWAKDVYQYGANTRANLVDAGIISQELSDKLANMYPHYVPFITDSKNINNIINDTGEILPRGAIKRAKGGANIGQVLPVQEALERYTYSQKKAVRQNQLYQQIVSTLSDGAIDIGADMREFDNNDFTSMSDSLYRDANGNYLTAYVDGERKSVRISEDLYNSLSNDAQNKIKDFENKFRLVTKPLQKISEIRRNLLTSWNPSFALTNPIKDIQDASLNSKYPTAMAKNVPKAVNELFRNNTDRVKQFRSLYGAVNAFGEFDANTLNQKAKNFKFIRNLINFNENMELAPRYAEFLASIENGASIQEAMYNAREVTTNFARGGILAKALNRNGFTFLNANIQGLSKFYRNLKGENGIRGTVGALTKAAILGIAPAVFNELAFGAGDDKDEEYEALPDYVKDNYYIIKTSDGNFIRIPKGRMLSIFGSAARRTIEAVEGEENAFEGYLKNAYDQVGVANPLNNNVFAPLIQAFGSENGTNWYGGDLVPTRLQDVPKGEQTDATIDAFSTWLGEKLNISPYKINYVLDQYSGGIGDIFLPMMTQEATNDTTSLTGQLLAPIKDKFTVNSTDDNKYVSDFYSKSEELQVKANSKNATDDDILREKYMYSISKSMSELYKERREVQADDSLTKEEKYAKSQAIKDEINNLAKVGLDGYSKVESYGNYAVVNDDMGYYKNTDGEWKPINQDDIEFTESQGLTPIEMSDYYSTKNNIGLIVNDYKEQLEGVEDENTKDKLYASKKYDIAQEIKQMNVPDETKAFMFDKYYSSADKLSVITNAGIDFNTYLDFASQTFTADKNSEGKTISGSKKQKVYNYINSMNNLNYGEKCILAKSEYKSDNRYNYDIINYLNNLDIDYDTEASILRELGFKVSDDGRITW